MKWQKQAQNKQAYLKKRQNIKDQRSKKKQANQNNWPNKGHFRKYSMPPKITIPEPLPLFI